MLPTIEQIREAQGEIAGAAIRTPLVRLNVTDAPAEIYLKLECLQPIGSFKIRGAANAMLRRSREELKEGVLTASAGNMAQGAAWCARELGVPCTVIAPDTAPDTKVRAVERLGGRVIKTDFATWWQAFETRSFPGERGVFIHAFDDPMVMAGNGTIGLEILEDLPDVDAVVVPWGGGGLACGIATAMRALKPDCKIFAAEVATAAPLSASWSAGSAQAIEYQPTFVDGIGARSVFPSMFTHAQSLIDGALVSDLHEVASALRLVAERNHVIAEGAGAVSVAAALAEKAGTGKVVCVVSGGNIDVGPLIKILSGESP
jgi:threonine dehydratase